MRKRIFKIIVKLVLLVILVVTVFLGVRNYRILKDVHQYDEAIATAVKKYDLKGQENLVAAIIYTETKGRHQDLMQSSESLYGETGKIADEEESIDAGVAFLQQALTAAKEANCDEETAIQAYNFGLDYIDYVAKRGGKNTNEIAESYSRDVLSVQLGNNDQTKYRYWGLYSVLTNGGYLYHNGGNLFYGKIVKLNQWKISVTDFLF